MSAQKLPPDDEKLTSLLLGQLSPEEADRLATEMLDNSQVTPAAEKLADDTLMAGVKQATTAVDAEADKLAGRLVERLKSEGEDTTAAYPDTGEAAEPMPTELEYFRVEKEIGRGGMGMVYLARDTRLNRPVAIKTLRADLAKKASAKERFLREARVAAALEHESIVPIYYVGEAGGIPFLAMPVLKGQGLDDHLKAHGGRLPAAEVIRIAAQIAGGLAAAHAVGLIHRDIKPSNVWVDADGRRVRVLDFGLARYEADESHLTVSGMIVGTPAYMAPEQARGRGVDARADLFSLGVVLYQMLTGKRPFTGTDAVSIISSLALDTPAAPNVVNFDVPSELSDLVMRLLEKEPQNRPASATVVREALDRLATQPTEDRTELDFSPPTPPRRKPKAQPKAARKFPLVPLAVAAGLFLLVAGGAAAVYQFVFSTKDGTLVVEVDDAADVRFKNGKLQVFDDKGTLKYTVEPSEKNKALPPGKYTVKVVGADGVKLDTEKFEIEKNGKVLVKVTATGTEVAKKPDPVKPDPGKSAGPLGDTVLTLSKECGVEAPDPGVDPKKPWTIEAYVTPRTEIVPNVGAGLITITDLGSVYYRGSKFGISADGFRLSESFMEVGKRVHLAGVRNDTRVSLFVDGKLWVDYEAKSQAELPALKAETKLLLGPLSEGREFHIQEVRVSQAARYTKDFTPPGRFTTDKETLALYHCDEGSGDKLTDSSGQNRHGKITNAKWGKASAVMSTDAKYALRFDVHSDGVRWHAVEMPTLKLPPKDPVTIEGWVKLDDPLGGYNNVLFGSNLQLAVGRGGGYVYTLPPGGKEAVSTGVPPLDVEKAFYALGKWQHVAVVRDTDEVRTYLDGRLAGRAASKDPLAEGTRFLFGNAGNGLSVREVRVSTAARYKGDNFTPESRFTPDKQTLALYHCDEGKGEQVADSSGNGHHGKISGFGPECMTKWVTPDGAAVGPGGPVTLPPTAPGTPLALRKPTWKPGPADNTLPGLATRPAILDGVGRWQIVPTVAAGSLSWSPDGKWVATTDADFVRIYDAATGAMSGIARHGAPPNHWAEPRWSADSKWVLCGVPAPPGLRFIAVFAADGTPGAFPPVAHAAADFGWNPKHPVFACVILGQDRVQIFDPTQAKPIEIDAKMGAKGRGVWSPDGETLLVVREDKSAQLFGRDGKAGAKLTGEVDPIAPPAWSADGSQLAAMGSATEVGFWKADGTAGKKTGKHEKPVLSLNWKPDGKLLAVSDAEGMRHFWKTDGTSEGLADTKDGTPGFVWAKDGKGFFTPGKYWPAVGNPSFTNLTNGLNMVAVVSPDQMSVALAKRGEIVIWEWKDGEAKDTGRKILQTADGVPWWSADGKRFAHADADGVAVYDARDPKKVVRLGGGAAVSGLNRAAFSPKGDRLAVVSSLGTVIVCEPTGMVLGTIPIPSAVPGGGAAASGYVHDVQWHPDGKHLVVCTGSVTVTVFDVESGRAEATTSVGGARAGGSAIFSPANPDHVLIAHPDAAALWQWKVEKEPQQRYPGLGTLIPSPDGKRVLALQAGAAHHGNDFITAALLSPDLKDRDTASTKEYIGQINHPGPSLAWHPDGKHLVVTRTGAVGGLVSIRSLDGKVVEEIKPDDDVTWLSWRTPVATAGALLGHVGDAVFLFDLATKKLERFGSIRNIGYGGQLTFSPDGKHVVACVESRIEYWNRQAKALEQTVHLLPNGEFVTLSPAGEVLAKSANADGFYRYVIEDKTGKLLLKTPAEMAPSLPKAAGPVGRRWPLDPTPADEMKFLAGLGLGMKVRDANGDHDFNNEWLAKPCTVVWASFWGADASKVDDAVIRRVAKLTDLEYFQYNFAKYDGVSVTTEGSRALAALVNLRTFDVSHYIKGGLDGSVIAKMPHLERLNVAGIPGSVWVKHVGGMTRLHTIDTFNTPISEEELGQLAKLPRLTLLLLHHPGASDDAVKAFAKKVPWCKVSKDVGGGNVLVIEPTALPPEGPTAFAPLDPEWVKAVAAMTPEKQYEAVIVEVKVRNPEFTGKGPRNGRVIEEGVLAELTLDGKLADVTPVRALPGLTRLSVCNTPDHNAVPMPLADLSQFQGMKLTHLSVWQAEATDLTPLKGLPLTKLEVFWMKVTDLTPLAGMPLEYLDLRGCPVQDLTPIKGLKLKVLGLLGTQVSDLKVVVELPLESLESGSRITDLAPLKGKKLKLLHFDGDVVSDLSPLKGMPLEELGWWGSKVTDLSPLEGMPLKNLNYELNLERDGKILRSLKSLATINGKPMAEVLK